MSLLKSILGSGSSQHGSFREGGAGRVPSMNDLSMGVGMDLDDVLPTDQSARRQSSEFSKHGTSPPGVTKPSNVWNSVFNPGRNPNMPKTSERFDTAANGAPSTWEYIVKAEKLSEDTFRELDTQGHGYITPEDLGRGLHIDINQVQALLKQADSNGDGKISFDEWVDVMKKSGSGTSSPAPPSPKTPMGGSSFKAPAQPEPCADHMTAFTSSKPEQIEVSRRLSANFQKGLKEAREIVLGTSPGGITVPSAPQSGGSFKRSGSPPTGDVWSSVFNPGRNVNMPKHAERFDIAANGAPTTWEYIKQAESAK